MKAILMSIRPQHLVNILNGEKTIEIRKTMPKCELPIDVYIYCTKDKKYANLINRGGFLTGMVVAKFTLNKVEEIICRPIWGEWESYTETLGYSEISQASCVGNREIVHYLKGNNGYAWHISNLVIFDKPKELGEFYYKRRWIVHSIGYSPYVVKVKTQVRKAPQSWQYIYIEEESK